MEYLLNSYHRKLILCRKTILEGKDFSPHYQNLQIELLAILPHIKFNGDFLSYNEYFISIELLRFILRIFPIYLNSPLFSEFIHFFDLPQGNSKWLSLLKKTEQGQRSIQIKDLDLPKENFPDELLIVKIPNKTKARIPISRFQTRPFKEIKFKQDKMDLIASPKGGFIGGIIDEKNNATYIPPDIIALEEGEWIGIDKEGLFYCGVPDPLLIAPRWIQIKNIF